MKQQALFITLAIFVCFAAAQEFEVKEGLLNNILPLHDDYVLSLARLYRPHLNVEHLEFQHFKESVRRVREHNKKVNATYTLSIDSPFAFMSDEQFVTEYLGSQDCSATAELTLKKPMKIQNKKNVQVPESINWKDLNKVSPVKDQQNCGSCWTFSTTGAIESHYAIFEDVEPTSLSEQQLIDCAGAFNNNGCSGGLPSQAFEYIKYNGGISYENSYYYIAQDQECQFSPETVGARVRGGSFNITQGDEDQLKQAVGTVGPVSIAFQVMGDFKLYKSGVYSNPDCSSSPQTVNHAVLAVGYGSENGVDYWYVKNSWSEFWGDEGYFKIQRGVNMCGVATCASYPLLEEQTEVSAESF
ncbi:papain family cysteine protease (macronuclear) [Tetrahymena thermophila SB210]|uniref:Papain family cysteine protease n=1 Tax=Tetrahymena thermophila (strain SB210) TaxID=312017 RepID=Q24HI2_TETTS|nr:papain family cysteine protease [Tetrahymena thermophila SB210]EAS07249.1 papain family cysteine protease [Tetrahymena thermophila SB210]|eukprot:XP_001027491.1 papain family cysteine protease [Tetrahymena thermophila SB210]